MHEKGKTGQTQWIICKRL